MANPWPVKIRCAGTLIVFPLVASCLMPALPAASGAGAMQPRAVSPKWKEVAPGVWRTRTGAADVLTPLGVVGATPRLEALSALGEGAFHQQRAPALSR